jgi:hydroxymethylglutaryl-CoA synthase
MGAHVPAAYLQLEDLAAARGVPTAKYSQGLGLGRMAVALPGEDVVVMAAQAALNLFQAWGEDPARVGLVAVGTESGVDGSKPVASFVQGLLGLPGDALVVDLQHGCFAATAALDYACLWVDSRRAAGRTALVLASDIARYPVGSPGEPTQGAAAVAMLVGPSPRVLELFPGEEGAASGDVCDFWRPRQSVNARVDGPLSQRSYLDALERTYLAFAARTGQSIAELDHLLYHAPFPAMVAKAHRRLLRVEAARSGRPAPSDGEVTRDLRARVEPALGISREVGNAYTASLYLQLVALARTLDAGAAGRGLSLYSYGSGFCATFSRGRVPDDFAPPAGDPGLLRGLAGRLRLDHEDYLRARTLCDARDEGLEAPSPWDPVLASRGLAFRFAGLRQDRRLYERP